MRNMATIDARLRRHRRNGKFKPVWKSDATLYLWRPRPLSATGIGGKNDRRYSFPDHDRLARWHFWIEIKLTILPPAGSRQQLFVACWLANRANIARSWHGWMRWWRRTRLVNGSRREHCVESFEQDQRHSKDSGTKTRQLLAGNAVLEFLQRETR